uniref:Ig-like domain-containing protein n=1 Tax=Pygocentrus nattereri TaxID=42514 RepID=A0AAR2IJ08_PYGNA
MPLPENHTATHCILKFECLLFGCVTSTPEETSSLTVPEGESVSLKCSFTFTREYNGVPFVVYWIKTVGESSTCVYSYDYSKHRSPQYGHHCAVQKDLLNRLSNPTEGQNSHNIRISEVMESDSGQYLCAVQVDPINKNTAKGNWKVIKRVTVITSTPEKPSSLPVPEGGSVSLNCSFTFTQKYNGVPFVVYWIKTVGKSSTCVYSYDYSKHRSPQYDLLNRISNPTKGQNSHNISISEVMESDSGQYLCAVQVDPINKNTAKGNWKVIKRVTVTTTGKVRGESDVRLVKKGELSQSYSSSFYTHMISTSASTVTHFCYIMFSSDCCREEAPDMDCKCVSFSVVSSSSSFPCSVVSVMLTV